MVIKQLPDHIAYSGKIESWLKDMAAEGFILKRMSRHFGIFKKGEPQDLEYRIMAYDEDYFVDEVLDDINKEGWTLIEKDVSPFLFGITFNHNKYYVCSKQPGKEPDRQNVSLHTNGWLEKKLSQQKHFSKNMLRASKILAVVGGLSYFIFFGLHVPGILLTLSVSCLLLAWLAKNDKKKVEELEANGIHKYQQWHTGVGMNRFKTYIRFILKGTIIVYSLLLAASPGLFMLRNNLDNVNNFIRIEDVQQAYAEDIEPTYGISIPSPFVPTYYKAIETGLSKSEDGNVKRVEYEIVYSKSIIPFVSKLPHTACVVRKLKGVSYQYMRPIKHTVSDRFDKITYLEFKWASEMNIYMCLSNNNEIIYIRYRGDLMAEDIIKNIESTLEK